MVRMFFLPLALALLHSERFHAAFVEEEHFCSAEGCEGQLGQALLQVKKTPMMVQRRGNTFGPGTTETLDANGFNNVRNLCCSLEMQDFIRRLIEESGKVVCIAGGLAGLTLWYDCSNDDSGNDFTKLQNDLIAAADVNGDCPWLGEKDNCPALKSTCDSFPDAEFSTCGGADSNRFSCCGLSNGFVATHENYSSTSTIDRWDCASNAGAIQVYTNEGVGPFYNVAMLDLVEKKYKTLYQIPVARTTPPMDKRMNSVSLNPVDGIPYATISIDAVKYIVRFDANKFEFIARIPALGVFSSFYEVDSLYVGAFGQSGTYYIGGNSKVGSGLDILAVQDVARYGQFADQNAVHLPELSPAMPGVSYQKFALSGSDIAVANGDFDKSGTVSEWLFLLSGRYDLGMIKPVNSVIGNVVPYKLKNIAEFEEGEGIKGFGAAWSFMNEVFFSRNNGDGVFHVMTDSIDLQAKTYTLSEVLKGTQQTNANDGMNCIDSPPPFSHNCKYPEFEVCKLSGKCPRGAHSVPTR